MNGIYSNDILIRNFWGHKRIFIEFDKSKCDTTNTTISGSTRRGSASRWPLFGASHGGVCERCVIYVPFMSVPVHGNEYRLATSKSSDQMTRQSQLSALWYHAGFPSRLYLMKNSFIGDNFSQWSCKELVHYKYSVNHVLGHQFSMFYCHIARQGEPRPEAARFLFFCASIDTFKPCGWGNTSRRTQFPDVYWSIQSLFRYVLELSCIILLSWYWAKLDELALNIFRNSFG